MGKIFYDMGLLSQAKVVDCSATDMIGQYVGQTGPKVQKLLEKAMGKVLFIDEAYRLAEGGFATEAMDELVDCLTKPKFAKKMITILAGYDKDIDRLMSINPGLTSRFPESVIFKHLEPEMSLELLVKVLVDLQKRKKAPLDLSVLTPPSSELHKRIIELFVKLSSLDSWGNARDVKSLARSMFGTLISTATQPLTELVLTEVIVTDTMEKTFAERSLRNKAVGTSRFPDRLPSHPHPALQQSQPNAPTLQARTSSTDTASALREAAPVTTKATKTEHQERSAIADKIVPADEVEDPVDSIFKAKRDPGVSDAVWEQLERDKHAMIAKEHEFRHLQEEKRLEEKRIEDLKRAEKEAADEEERRIREQERMAAEMERRRKEAILAAIEQAREDEKQRQKKLRELGPCPAGYRWTKQSSGYRCAGGSHFLDDAMLDKYVRSHPG
jgi:hypothetical protein